MRSSGVWADAPRVMCAGAGAVVDAFALLGKSVIGGALMGSKAVFGTTLKVSVSLCRVVWCGVAPWARAGAVWTRGA